MSNQNLRTAEAGVFQPQLLLTVFFLFFFPCLADAADRPLRVVSMNLCTDQFLLALADREQIISLSPFATDKASSYLGGKAAGLPRIPGGSESVLRLKPDVLLATQFDRKSSLKLVEKQGVKVVVLNYPGSLKEIAEQYRIIGNAIGQKQRGEQYYTRFLETLKKSRHIFSMLKISALYYQSGGYASGRHSLVGMLFDHIGLKNHANRHSISYYGNVSIEEIVANPPDIFMIARYTDQSEDQGHKMLEHPALKQILAKKRVIAFPVSETVCPGPGTQGALKRLIQLRQSY
ncbi:MAG: ABC transporter substrate-binding protein [Methyloligellaceae bacterium]